MTYTCNFNVAMHATNYIKDFLYRAWNSDMDKLLDIKRGKKGVRGGMGRYCQTEKPDGQTETNIPFIRGRLWTVWRLLLGRNSIANKISRITPIYKQSTNMIEPYGRVYTFLFTDLAPTQLSDRSLTDRYRILVRARACGICLRNAMFSMISAVSQ